jgi:peroxisomal membrane protein 4
MSTIKAILDDPRFHDYVPILKGARNGLVYGVKVRFPHALIMAILFGRGRYVLGPARPFFFLFYSEKTR